MLTTLPGEKEVMVLITDIIILSFCILFSKIGEMGSELERTSLGFTRSFRLYKAMALTMHLMVLSGYVLFLL